MNVPQEDLNRWRAFAEQVRSTCHGLYIAVSHGKTEQAKERLDALAQAAAVAGKSMERAGADRSEGKPLARVVPLSKMDTPANRAYLGALRAAHAAALAVDRERYGENIGTDGCAQAVELILTGVEQEVYGAVGRLRE